LSNFNTSASEADLPTSNLVSDNEMGFSARDVTAEKRAMGYFNQGSTALPEGLANDNPNVVVRDGVRQYVNGDYRSDDRLVIQGIEMTHETAVSLGLIQGNTLGSPGDDQGSNPENTGAEVQQDTRPERAQLLDAQLELSFGERAPEVLEVFGRDVIENGEIGPSGLDFARKTMGMPEAAVREIYEDMREAGSQVMADYMEIGDGRGWERIEFLADIAENGTKREREEVRRIWFKAATGKLSRQDATRAFDRLYNPYVQ
jgi:hypothetical protein